MFLILLILFTLIPAIEIYLLFSIGGQIGGLNTLFVVVVTGVIGASLAKSQGLSILNRIQSNLNQGEIPTDQFIHGLLVFGGGLLLLTPGFLTDFLGLSMVMPGSRNLIAHFMKNFFSKHINSGKSGVFFSSSNTSSNFHYNSNEDSKSQSPSEEIEPGLFEAEFRETSVKDDEKL